MSMREGTDIMSLQKQVSDNIITRGYREGYSLNTFAGRQFIKLVEEIGELLQSILGLEKYFYQVVKLAGDQAHWLFDMPATGLSILLLEAAKRELADVQVVIFSMAQAIAEIEGKPFDVGQAALEKSQKDIERGIR